MEAKTNRIVNLRPPTQSTVPGTGVTRLATSTTSAAVDLTPSGAQFFGKHLRLYNEDATNSIWLTFAAVNTTAVSSAAAAGADVTTGTLAANGYRLAPGASIDVRLTKSLHKYIVLQASAATPVLCIFPVSPGVAAT